ncbi:MerR family DNA-binding transcriptional regulator [Brevibacterium sp. 5221]|uniref:MerR family DNA-binding transcriptional regulator n=1 Tax=Brevibacterium rongguiense TaxID=2695267 RepID=A0A6N9H8G2_9MICO|nr:MerR family transcriptional regulator [Brevibacterium rongguiense]MYM20195.1 MerR family DNA-binding transcriptional regulator [Brevibacterium rongguiense]
MLIGELSRRSGVSVRMLRHYEAKGLLTPEGRSAAGYRQYGDPQAAQVAEIEALRALGLSLDEVGLAREALLAPAEVLGVLCAESRRRAEAEQRLQRRLEQIAAAGPTVWDDVLAAARAVDRLVSVDSSERVRALLGADAAHEMPTGALAEALAAEADPNVAGAIAWQMARRGPSALEALRTMATLPTPAARLRAVRVLAGMEGEDAAAALAGFVDDPVSNVRATAVLALARRGDAAVVGDLVDLVCRGRQDVEAGEALEALAAVGATARAATAEFAARWGGADVPVRRRIVQALVDLPGEEAQALLRVAAADSAQAVSATARFALRYRG